MTVRLINSSAVVVITTQTDADGFSSFVNLAPDTYVVEVDYLGVLTSSPGGQPDPNDDVNNDDNGVSKLAGGVRSGSVTLTVGGEPTNDGDANADSNLSVDFGLVTPPEPARLGDRVFDVR